MISKAQQLHKASSERQPKYASDAKPPKHDKLYQGTPLSLADRAARINNDLGYGELPAIEEAFDKENDTFA